MHEPRPPRLLLADDEPLYLQATSQLLRKSGYDCTCVADADAAIRELRSGAFDLVLTDLNMPGNLKLELLRASRQDWPDVPLVVVTGVPSLPTAIESVRLGIADYLIKPVKFETLLASIRRILVERELKASPVVPVVTPNLVGSSPAMKAVSELVGRIAQSDSNVLISGESGTGKELIAKAIHRASRRAGEPLQVIDCTAIPESLFESLLFGHAKGSFTGAVDEQEGLLKKSDRGVAFFDEIGELPLTLQPKLLRVIQEQTFTPIGKTEPLRLSTRIISATNRNLLQEVSAGRFRSDLFYRLSVLHIELPPLRQRGDDTIELAEHFLKELTRPGQGLIGFTPSALTRLKEYPWPGNVRELHNAIESAVALCRSGRIDVSDLPERVARGAAPDPPLGGEPHGVPVDVMSVASGSREEALGSTDKNYFLALMRQYHGNISRAAQHAGLSRQTLHKLLNKHGILAADFRRGF